MRTVNGLKGLRKEPLKSGLDIQGGFKMDMVEWALEWWEFIKVLFCEKGDVH